MAGMRTVVALNLVQALDQAAVSPVFAAVALALLIARGATVQLLGARMSASR